MFLRQISQFWIKSVSPGLNVVVLRQIRWPWVNSVSKSTQVVLSQIMLSWSNQSLLSQISQSWVKSGGPESNQDDFKFAYRPVTLRVRPVGDNLRPQHFLWSSVVFKKSPTIGDFGGFSGYRQPLCDHSVIERYLVHAVNTSLWPNGCREVACSRWLVGDWSLTVVRWSYVVSVRLLWFSVVTDQ